MMSVWAAAIPSVALAGAMLVFLPWISPTNRRARRVLVVAILALQWRYVIWRTLQIVRTPGGSPIWYVAMLFLLFEVVAHLLAVRGTLLFTSYRDRGAEASAHQNWWAAGAASPLVDIFIATYNESRTVLERTVVGATSLDYGNYRVWILDDGKREWLRQFAASKAVGYLTRENNEFYKAGNLNNAFRHVNQLAAPPDFVVVLDADFILLSHFLTRTLALMHDPRVAIVQTPQHFYNPDPFQYALRAATVWPDDQRVWFDSRLPALDGRGGATCCGTSFLLRMTAFNELGAMPTESISEDTLLSIKLRTLGWQTAYLDEVLSVGLAPEGVKEFLTQRARWCLGGLQIATHRIWGPRGLIGGVWGHIIFIENFLRLTWYATMRVLWTGVPITFLFFGLRLLMATPAEMLSFLGPFAIARTGLSWLTRGALLPVVTDSASIILCPVLMRAAFRVVTNSPKQGFDVTDKGTSRGKTVVHWKVLRLPLALLIFTGAGLAYSCLVPTSPLRSAVMPGILLFWTLSSLMSLYGAIVPCIESPKYRASERYDAYERTTIRIGNAERADPATILDLSEDGALLSSARPAQRGDQIELDVSGVGRVSARVVRSARNRSFGVQFQLDDRGKESMIRKIYCSGRYIRQPSHWSFAGSLLALARSLTRN